MNELSLRVRVAAVVAIIVTAVVVIVGVTVQRAAESELVQEVDLELIDRAAGLVDGPERGPGGVPNFRDAVQAFPRNRRPPDAGDFGPQGRIQQFVGGSSYARLLDENGDVLSLLGSDFDVVVDEALLADASDGPTISEALIDGVRAHAVTFEIPGVGFVQIARSLGEIEHSMDGLRRQIILIGSLSILVAAAMGYVASAGTVRPIERLTDAASAVAFTGDLDHPVDGAGGAEVGRLASSFNAMLAAISSSRSQQHRLVMDASHELRTPLASLQTNVDVLRRATGIPAQMRAEILGDVHAELGELTELVTELVDLATDVRDDEDPVPLELADLVAPIAERSGRRTSRQVDVTVRSRAVVEARPAATSRAIRNLIDNAAKFSPAGSPIRVEIDGGAVTVHDQGPGIAESERERIFDRFHRVEATRTLPGSGLGLAIVKQVAEAHGGQASMAPSPDGGSAFTLQIPTVDD